MEPNRQEAGRHVSRTGFTLMEVLLVLVILVVLGTMAVSVFSGMRDKADRDAARIQVGLFKNNVDRYQFDTRKYPQKLEDLIAKPSDAKVAERWAGPYMNVTKIPVDAWDNPYRYESPGKRNPSSFDVWSVGPDGQDGTDDDIGNWES